MPPNECEWIYSANTSHFSSCSILAHIHVLSITLCNWLAGGWKSLYNEDLKQDTLAASGVVSHNGVFSRNTDNELAIGSLV